MRPEQQQIIQKVKDGEVVSGVLKLRVVNADSQVDEP